MTDSTKVTKTITPAIHTINIPFSVPEMKIMFAVLTQEKFTLGDAIVIAPIAKKLQDHIPPEPVEKPKEPVFPVSKSN